METPIEYLGWIQVKNCIAGGCYLNQEVVLVVYDSCIQLGPSHNDIR